MIIMITVNNQTKQDGVTVIMVICGGRRGTVRFASSFCCTPDFFFCVFRQALDAQQAECSICSAALCAAWLWHLRRQPWVLQRGRLLSAMWGQFGLSLGMQRLACRDEVRKHRFAEPQHWSFELIGFATI